jgi:hypothetical protein
VVRTALNLNISRWRRRRREVPVADLGLLAAPPELFFGSSDGDHSIAFGLIHTGSWTCR